MFGLNQEAWAVRGLSARAATATADIKRLLSVVMIISY
jgi:hypothetical protein